MIYEIQLNLAHLFYIETSVCIKTCLVNAYNTCIWGFQCRFHTEIKYIQNLLVCFNFSLDNLNILSWFYNKKISTDDLYIGNCFLTTTKTISMKGFVLFSLCQKKITNKFWRERSCLNIWYVPISYILSQPVMFIFLLLQMLRYCRINNIFSQSTLLGMKLQGYITGQCLGGTQEENRKEEYV